MFNIYNVEIQKIHSTENLPTTHFSVLEHKISGVILEILIEFQSQGNPEIQGLLDERNDKFYLVGGKIDSPAVTMTADSMEVTLAKTNQAWISINLSQLGKKGEIKIFKRMPAMFVFQPYQKISDAHDALLMKIIL